MGTVSAGFGPMRVFRPSDTAGNSSPSAGHGPMGESLNAGTAGGMTSGAASIGSVDAAVLNTQNDLQEFHLEQEVEVPNSTKGKVLLYGGESDNASALERNLDTHENTDSCSFGSDDGESDFDVPEALLSNETTADHHGLEAITKNIDLVVFFQCSSYRTMSLLFGPMICFFLVATRVQIFNIYAGDYIDQTAYESFKMTKLFMPSFWLQVSLYCIMMVEMLLVIIVFLSKRGAQGTLVCMNCSAAVFGLLVSASCLTFLLAAEIKRTCPDNDTANTRLLDPSEDFYEPATEDVTVECNPKFGERNEALGTVEPFTSLILLFPLRFFVARYVVRLFGNGASQDEEKGSHEGESDHHHGADPTSQVRDLWMTSIGTHSNVARSFGPFSAELLQCMLGIYVEYPETLDANDESTAIVSIRHHKREKSMDSTFEYTNRMEVISDPPAVDQLPHAPLDCLDLPIREPAVDRLPHAPGDRLDAPIKASRGDDRFAYPNARLLRKMRRCEMRLLPLLNEWETVDVVITKHELILFDVDDVTGTSTKSGGKRKQLYTVAKGRTVMDTFNLDDVNFVDIEHRAATLGGTEFGEDEVDIEMNHIKLLEHWEGGIHNYVAADDTMDKRWGNVDEDRLKIHFKSPEMTLFLRFMADLKDMEDRSKISDVADEGSDLMNHVGTETTLWCRTIARLRGANNLKQHLPHFGNDCNDEMEDFIEMCERDGEGGNHNTHTMREVVSKRFSLDQSVLTTIFRQSEPTQIDPAVGERRPLLACSPVNSSRIPPPT